MNNEQEYLYEYVKMQRKIEELENEWDSFASSSVSVKDVNAYIERNYAIQRSYSDFNPSDPWTLYDVEPVGADSHFHLYYHFTVKLQILIFFAHAIAVIMSYYVSMGNCHRVRGANLDNMQPTTRTRVIPVELRPCLIVDEKLASVTIEDDVKTQDFEMRIIRVPLQELEDFPPDIHVDDLWD
eukprot:CAMPEP_0185281102 /NCGR_PEP_ID=MMETSP1359-20130426/66528_1 /TAXON_ID=552665 /ORGANISM="Bigelowiella longifila, Strain CCMP242" /LENGTH=182 /DNA_ID=CAMNT_0027876489 /DNA_START=509 /DNA_END=1057 /DNA_ORIENTATION=-